MPLLKKLTHLPVIVDPSHATGRWDLVTPMSAAAIASGADGLLIEVHSNPEQALSDGPQSLKPPMFEALIQQVRSVSEALGRRIHTSPGALRAFV